MIQKKEPRKAEVILEYQNVIEHPPVTAAQLYAQACSNDSVTVDTWRPTWIKNIKANKVRFGSFKDHSIGKFFGLFKHQPAIVVGSGPSLKYNAKELLNKGSIPVVSCLHNFHFLEDLGVDVDFYITLDAGPVVLEEVYEGGSKTPEEYWAMTKGKNLLAYIGTDPKLFDLWQGEVYFFNAPIPDPELQSEIEKIEKFNVYISNGGNVLGACMYFAKAFLGCNPIAFMGADFCFSYEKKFHPWDSKYDAKLGYVIKLVDVFGNKVLSWQSYANFKGWFEWVAMGVPGIYINCSEGGTLGAFQEGNMAAITQMELSKFINMYRFYEEIQEQAENSLTEVKKLLF